MKAIVLFLVAALCCGSIHAAVPHQINYQGYLTSPGGAPGTYVLDHEMSVGAAGSVGIYKGPVPVALSPDTTSIAGASTATTWIHGRTLIAVGGSPVVFEVSPVVGTAFVATAGTAAGVYMIRLTILKIS